MAASRSQICQTVQNELGAIGLAVIVTNDYTDTTKLDDLVGTLCDGKNLSEAFTKLRFAVHWERNVDQNELKKIIDEISSLEYQLVENYRCIIFIFAGHGCEGDNLFMQDGTTINICKDIIDPLLSTKSNKVQKIFLIDACRGRKDTIVPRCNGPPEELMVASMKEIPNKGGFLVAYSTMPQHKAYEDKQKGGLWFSTFVKLLQVKKYLSLSIEDLLTEVNGEMEREMQRSGKFQQPEKISRLSKIVYLDPNCKNI